MHLFHVTTASAWAEARARGSYTTSTLGRSLAEEGFIHAARREQVPTVFERYYRDVREPLVLLTIDTARLEPPWREEAVGEETYPHILGPVNTSAVVAVAPLDRRGRPRPFTTVFVRDLALRAGLAILAMLLAVVGAALAPEWGRLLGALAGLGVGAVLYVRVQRRR
ncbi:MAG TPA: DUF952 domain-containing protein [Nocardioides sp.]|uniref:DUF952 domain-containing protein n=1 Tax=Nocardioides sp. TaxID=35761 RepID=UPI002C0A157E|nr:DUF952 domain-containing protein [Nocardioides sp.]HQR25837.1 DUF952 domain-containing protein [Nocardioides sp.]